MQLSDCLLKYAPLISPLTAFIAAIAALCITKRFQETQASIARQQAQTAKDKLRLDLFEKRYECYRMVKTYPDEVIETNQIEYNGRDAKFLVDIAPIYWLFGEDIYDYVSDHLHTLMFAVAGHAREGKGPESEYAHAYKALLAEADNIKTKFAPFLQLGHLKTSADS